MATFGNKHTIHIIDEIAIISDQVYRDVFDGNSSPTMIVLRQGGTIDAVTEEVTYTQSNTKYSASGIVSYITEKDMLLGYAGKMKVGDVAVCYHFSTISGVYASNKINAIELNVPSASGLYNVSAQMIGAFAGTPIYVKYALELDANG